MISISHWGMFPLAGYEGMHVRQCGYNRDTSYLLWMGNY